MTNRKKGEGFKVGDVVVAMSNAQGLVKGQSYRVASRRPSETGAGIEYEVRGISYIRIKGDLKVRNLTQIAEPFER